MGRVVQESSSVLMVNILSGPRRVSSGSGCSGWSAEETWSIVARLHGAQTFKEPYNMGLKTCVIVDPWGR